MGCGSSVSSKDVVNVSSNPPPPPTVVEIQKDDQIPKDEVQEKESTVSNSHIIVAEAPEAVLTPVSEPQKLKTSEAGNNEVEPSDPLPTSTGENGTETKCEEIGIPFPPDETERAEYLYELKVFETAPEERFDVITKLCCDVFKVPVALINLMDGNNACSKSTQGIPVYKGERKLTVCSWVLLAHHPEVLMVEDLSKDARFKDLPSVASEAGLRFYAGCPLVGSLGYRMGSLCLINMFPGTLDIGSLTLQSNIAEVVSRELEQVYFSKHPEVMAAATVRQAQVAREAVFLVDLGQDDWPVLLSSNLKTTLGLETASRGTSFWDIFQVNSDSAGTVEEARAEAIAEQKAFTLWLDCPKAMEGDNKHLLFAFRSATKDCLSPWAPRIGVPCKYLGDDCPHKTLFFATLSDPSMIEDDDNVSVSGVSVDMRDESRLRIPSAIKPKKDKSVVLGQLLGEGWRGQVYRATWNGKKVAVKVLPCTSSMPSPVVTSNDGRENSASSVLPIMHMLTKPARKKYKSRSPLETWKVMELCSYGNLSGLVEQGWLMEPPRLLSTSISQLMAIAMEVARALAHLHAQGIVHGDLNGNNVLLTQQSDESIAVRVADVGETPIFLKGPLNPSGTVPLSISQCAPEVIATGVITPSSDVYSFGMLLWEMYMAREPYIGLKADEIARRAQAGKVPELSTGCPAPLRHIIQECLALEPEKRPPIHEVIDWLTEFSNSMGLNPVIKKYTHAYSI